MAVKIKSPKGKAFVIPKLDGSHKDILLASGTADADVTGVTGSLKVNSVQKDPGILLALYGKAKKQGNAAVKTRRWVMLFLGDFPDGGSGELVVAGVPSGGDTEDFTIKQVPRISMLRDNPNILLLFALITSHVPGDNVTAQADVFTAFGDSNHFPLQSVTMNAIQPDFVFEDPDNEFWSARFPTLASGVYTLTVVDGENH